MRKEPVVFVGGQRFEASVSANRAMVDLNDLKGARFKTLQIGEIDEAIELLIQVREFMLKQRS